jgi:hypothetical protein
VPDLSELTAERTVATSTAGGAAGTAVGAVFKPVN